MPTLLLGVAVAGGVGAVLRFVVDGLVTARFGMRQPWGTFVVNVTGSFVLGLLAGLAGRHLAGGWYDVLGTGLLGGYTTFSTAMWESLLHVRDRRWRRAGVHVLGMLVAGVAAAAAGLALGSAA